MKTFYIGRVNDKDDCRGVGVVAPPVGPDACLASQILRAECQSCIDVEQLTTGDVSSREDLHTQTLKLRFLYVTDSTLNPIVGIVVTTSPIYVVSAVAHTQDRRAGAGTDLESVQERGFASIVLQSRTSVTQITPEHQRSAYQAQNQYSYLLLCPEEAGQP